MKFRTSKKIIFCHHSSWWKRLRKLRAPYINDDGRVVYPSVHDIAQVAKAKKVYLTHLKRNKK